jgi:Mitochondrial carrier protein
MASVIQSFKLKEKTKKDISASSISASVAVLACSPLELVKMNSQVTSSNMTIRSMFKDVYRTFGMKGFYKGLGVSMIAQPGYWTIYMPIFNNLKDKYSNEDGTIDMSKKMGIIFASSSVASMAVNPLFVFKTRFQTSVLKKNVDGTLKHPKMSYSSLIKNMISQEGIRGFYKGNMVAQFKNTQMLIQMPLYDFLYNSDIMNQFFSKSDIPFLDKSFISGVLAKTVASCVVYYPIDSIRTNLRDNVENKSISRIVKDIYSRPGGVINFYRGVGIYWISAVPTFGIIIYGIEKLKHF